MPTIIRNGGRVIALIRGTAQTLCRAFLSSVESQEEDMEEQTVALEKLTVANKLEAKMDVLRSLGPNPLWYDPTKPSDDGREMRATKSVIEHRQPRVLWRLVLEGSNSLRRRKIQSITGPR
jgi:hypothetical protein